MPSTKLENVGGAKIGGESEKERELNFIQVRLHFLWNISELPIRLSFVCLFSATELSLYIFLLISYQIHDLQIFSLIL